jgi:hypothetical protein
MRLIRWHYARANWKPDVNAQDYKQAAGQTWNRPEASINRRLRLLRDGLDVGDPTTMS